MLHTRALILFQVDASLLAIPLGVVDRVLWMVELAPVPSAPSYLAGLLNLHGQFVPVVDVRRKLGRPSRPFRSGDRLILLSEPAVALAVDHIDEVVEVPENCIQPVSCHGNPEAPRAEQASVPSLSTDRVLQGGRTTQHASVPWLASVLARGRQAVLLQDPASWLSSEDELLLQRLLSEAQPLQEVNP